MPRKDFTQTASSVLQQAVGEEKKKVTAKHLNSDRFKNSRAGGLARKNNLSPKELSEQARKAANARWGKS